MQQPGDIPSPDNLATPGTPATPASEATATLRPDDAAALDARLEYGGAATTSPGNSTDTDTNPETGRTPGEGDIHGGGVARVLAILSRDAATRQPISDTSYPSLLATTLARVDAARSAAASALSESARPETGSPASHDPSATRPLTLSPDDAAAIDALLEAGGGGTLALTASAADDTRTRRARQLLAVVGRSASARDTAPASASRDADEALVGHTLAAVAAQRQREKFAQQVAMYAEPRRTLGVSWRQLVSAAAVLVVGVSLLFPALENQRQQAQQIACMGNLGIAGQQMNAYAVDHAGMLPRGPVGPSWIKAGQPDAIDDAGRFQSNSAHLYLLIREAYVAPERLACASNANATTGLPGSGQRDWLTPAAISYSYQNQHTPRPILIQRSRPRLAVLADKNPLFVVRNHRLVFDPDADRDAASSLHGNRGQNILTLDGRVRWNQTPTVGDDNVYQIAGHRGTYTGTEVPADARRDSFLVP